MDASFAKAQQTLSTHYRELADRAHAAGDDVVEGRYLERAADALRGATAWSGEKLDEALTVVVRDSKAAGAAMIRGAGWTLSKAGELTVRLGEATEELGDRL